MMPLPTHEEPVADADSVARARVYALESAFCRDFVCCNQNLRDLYALLEHYEESHPLPFLSNTHNCLGNGNGIVGFNARDAGSRLTGPSLSSSLTSASEVPYLEDEEEFVSDDDIMSMHEALMDPYGWPIAMSCGRTFL
jgi:hypothetical protein